MNKKNGFYTIESIIAIIIFLIGIIAVVKIQGDSITNTSQTQYRLIANTLGESMVGQMWLDKNNITQYDSNQFYDDWVNQLTGFLPGVNQNLPQVDIVQDGDFFNVKVQIFWVDPTTKVLSNHTIETTVY